MKPPLRIRTHAAGKGFTARRANRQDANAAKTLGLGCQLSVPRETWWAPGGQALRLGASQRSSNNKKSLGELGVLAVPLPVLPLSDGSLAVVLVGARTLAARGYRRWHAGRRWRMCPKH